MKKLILLSLALITSLMALSQKASLAERLKQIPEIKQVTKLSTDTLFKEKYLLMIEQPVDHHHPEKGTFTQRVFLSHLGYDQPVVFTTEGYAAWYELMPRYVNELSVLLHANQLTVEHRYFGKSVPDSLRWKYLTVEQAATDHHKVIELLKGIYDDNKWLNTGISKGGQTAIYHRYHFPDDVDMTVGYVCPLNYSFEDARVYTFLEQVGTEDCRNKLLNYQKYMLKNKETFLPMFRKASEKKQYTYPFNDTAAYEMVILEYPFAFWQWGTIGCNAVPDSDASDSVAFAHLQEVSPFDYFSTNGISRLLPFFYQAMTEIGYYGYDLEPYGDLIESVEDATFMFTIPEEIEISYDYTKMQDVRNWLQSDAERMLFIYGESDPWSATAVETGDNEKLLKIVKPNGSHRTRIRNLPPQQKEEAYKVIREWMDVELNPFK
jgi:hypothetical protein